MVARNNSLTSVPEGMELIPELKVIDLKGNPFDDGAKVSTIRRFGRHQNQARLMAKFFTLVWRPPRGWHCMRRRPPPGVAGAAHEVHDGLIKVNLTDFISGKYSLSYERVIGPWTTAEFTATALG